VEVRHITRSSSATHHPEVDTGAKSEFEFGNYGQRPQLTTSVLHQFYINWLLVRPRCGGATNGPSWLSGIPSPGSDLRRSAGRLEKL
jgi:hypothetical protein